jgi:hypothetical protein
LEKNQNSQGAKSGLQGGLTDLGDAMFCQKKKACTGAVEWAGALMQIR